MKTLLLAAGRSKRIKPIEDKNFLSFCGKPLLQFQIEQLFKANFHDIIVIGGAHNLDKLQQLTATLQHDQNFSGLSLQVVEQKDLDDGMAGALLATEPYLDDGPFFVVSSNDIVDFEAYKSVLQASANQHFDSFLLAKKVSSYFPGGYLKINANGAITNIVEKPGEGNEPGDLVNIVAHFHRNTKTFFQALKTVQSQQDDRYEVTMDKLIQQGTKMQAVPYDGFWKPIKYPWEILEVMDHFLQQLPPQSERKNVDIAETAVIRGQVYLEEGVRIFDHAVISGPVYLGKNTIVANNALVRGSMIGENSVVGFGTEIARSYLGNNIWTHTNYIGDSIISDNCSFGSGSVTGNLRLDETTVKMNIQDQKIDSGRTKLGVVTGKGVRCGINTSLMPGIKIGNNTFIGAGIVIAQDIPDQTLVYAKTELITKENKAIIDTKRREEMKKKLRDELNR